MAREKPVTFVDMSTSKNSHVEFVYEAASEEATAILADALAQHITPGTTVALIGTLGAGKTRFVQAFAQACGVLPGAVISPTYVLCQEYPTDRFTIYHLDVYRLEEESEFFDLGPEELFAGNGVTLIEWADRVADFLPTDRLEVEILVTGETCRRFQLRATGPSMKLIVHSVRGDLGG